MGDKFKNSTIVIPIILVILGMFIGAGYNQFKSSQYGIYTQDAATFLSAPTSYIFSSAFSFIAQASDAVRPRRAILRENKELKARVEKLSTENLILKDCNHENQRLRNLLGLQESIEYKNIAAELISRQESSWFDTFRINKGKNSGVVVGAAVINQDGLVGQVVAVGHHTSQVVALTDMNSSVAAMVQRSRSQGMLYGQGTDFMILTYLPKDADIKEKDIIVSSGAGQVIPKGICIGEVVSIQKNAVAGTTAAFIKPYAKIDQIEHVLVINPVKRVSE
ncbi:MAG: rod shape-determining protein MreC [Armatimonadota bacterium]